MQIDENVRELVRNYLKPKTKFIPGESYIPVAFAVYDEKELEALVQAALGFKFVDGELSHQFELEMARFLGTRYATFCNSGSSANLLAFMSLTSSKLGSRALQPGDEVITCAVGFPTTVAPILQAGCIPVFVDVSLGTYNPTPFMVAGAITEKTKAIFLAHTLGNPYDVDAIKDIADQNELWLIEDCADAIGSRYSGKSVGTIGNISTTSFYPAHMMTTGEGGMVFTDNAMLNQIVRSLRDWGRECWCLPNRDNTCGKRFSHKNQGELPDCYDHKYVYSHIGYNLKSTDLQASIGLEQIRKLPEFIKLRKRNWSLLHSGFVESSLDNYFLLPTYHEKSEPFPFGFVLTIKDTAKFTRTKLVKYLEEHKIGTRNLFGGNITRQPAFVGKGRVADSLPKSDVVMNNSFWIGCHPAITEEMAEYIVKTFKEFIDENRPGIS